MFAGQPPHLAEDAASGYSEDALIQMVFGTYLSTQDYIDARAMLTERTLRHVVKRVAATL